MNKLLKKSLCLSAGLIAGTVFVICIILDVSAFIDAGRGELSVPAAGVIAGMSVGVMFLCMLAIIKLNRGFDEGEGIVQKNLFMGRWPMNTLFASLVATVVFAMIYTNETGRTSLLSSGRNVSPAILTIAILAAAYLYLQNYHRFIPRNRQISRVLKKNSLSKKRRFTFEVEEILEDGTLRGIVCGEVHRGDYAYVYGGQDEKKKVRITKLFASGRKVRRAYDVEAVIYVPEDRNGIAPVYEEHTVLSSVRSGSFPYHVAVAENPRISGLLSVYGSHLEDNRFMSALIYEIVHGHYLTAAKCDDPDANSGDITEAMNGSHNVMFQAVSTSRDPDETVFPVFTDWSTLSRYANVMEDEKSLALIMDFQQASEMLNKGYDGIVINPFGPYPFYLSREYITSIKSLEGYRREFILKEDTE